MKTLSKSVHERFSMQCPSIGQLPSPPAGRTGWPWTESSASPAAVMPDGGEWPLITVVTPSFNQARFLEGTLRSILLQGYPNLEYIVMDGGSTDGSVDIIKKYSPWLTHWVSERDGGQSSAINKGLQRATGSFVTWINSDDMLCRDALTTHATRVGFRSGVVYVGDCWLIDAHDAPRSLHRARVHSLEDLLRVRSIWRSLDDRGFIVQPEVLFPRELAARVGGVDVHNHRTMDYELWGKFFLTGATFQYTHIPFGMFRVHDDQKTGQGWATTQSLIATARKLLAEAKDLSEPVREAIVGELEEHERDYWRETGRLARLGLPERLVAPLRDMQASLWRRAANFVRRAS